MSFREGIDDAHLLEIEARSERARPGPWTSWVEGRDHTSGSNIITIGNPSDGHDDIELLGATPADQDFIASARSDIPALVKEVRRLKRLLGELGSP